MAGGDIYHSTGYVYGLYEEISGQSIPIPADTVSVYLLYRRSAPGNSRLIVAQTCELTNAKEFQLLLIGTITKTDNGYNLVNDWIGTICDTVTRTSTFNTYIESNITETQTQTGIVLTENITGWKVTAGPVQYSTNQSLTLPELSGEFPAAGYSRKYASLTYNPSSQQYSVAWLDQPPDENAYMWWLAAVQITAGKTADWIMTAPEYQEGTIIVRDRWQ